MNLIVLLFAHFIGDAGLQPSWMIKGKKTNWYVLLEHCFIWTGVVAIGLMTIGKFETWKIPFLLVGHFSIDMWKIFSTDDPLDMKYLLIDQFMHLLQLLFVL